MTATPASKTRLPLAGKIGLASWAVALLWWFAYYAQYQGPFDLLGAKFSCINGATRECEMFQSQIATAIPTYDPVFWYAGLFLGAIGCWQAWKAKGSN
ncbi:MAG: hypothetical protein AB7O50_01185 [Pseudolabrys sp.]